MKNEKQIVDEIKKIKSQIRKVRDMNKPHAEEWLRGYWTALEYVLEDK